MDHDRRWGVATAAAVLVVAVLLMGGVHALAGRSPLGLAAAVALLLGGLAAAGRLGRVDR